MPGWPRHRGGDRIAVLAENRIECHVLLGAAARLGAIYVSLNGRLLETELAGMLADFRPAMLVTDDATIAPASVLLEAAQPRLSATFGAP